MTSLRRRPTTDNGTDIATLIRRNLAEVCTVSALGVPWCEKALYKYSSFPFLSFLVHNVTVYFDL